MKSKVEIKLDNEFEKLDIKPKIYHFTEHVKPFTAITIVTADKQSWKDIRKMISIAFETEQPWLRGYLCPATRFINRFAFWNIHGVAICNERDIFNRQRGRIIAKGRLLKYIKENEGT